MLFFPLSAFYIYEKEGIFLFIKSEAGKFFTAWYATNVDWLLSLATDIGVCNVQRRHEYEASWRDAKY